MGLNFGQDLFPPRQEILVNYDYFDISNGTGYSIFYGGNNAGTTTTSPEIFYSGMIHLNGTTTAVATETWTEIFDKDFDITFNMPKNIKGNILSQVPFGVKAKSSNTENLSYKITINVYHYDGTTETSIADLSTSEIIYTLATGFGVNVISSHISTIKSNVTSKTHFKKGETLRITIKMQVRHTRASSLNFLGGLGTDPMNRTDALIQLGTEGGLETDDEPQIIETNEPTQLKFHIPFKLDI